MATEATEAILQRINGRKVGGVARELAHDTSADICEYCQAHVNGAEAAGAVTKDHLKKAGLCSENRLPILRLSASVVQSTDCKVLVVVFAVGGSEIVLVDVVNKVVVVVIRILISSPFWQPYSQACLLVWDNAEVSQTPTHVATATPIAKNYQTLLACNSAAVLLFTR